MKKELRHDIRISKPTARKLNIIKADLGLKNADDVVVMLLDNYSSKKVKTS